MRRIEADDEEEWLVVVVADLLGNDPHRVGGLPLFPFCPLRRFRPGVGAPAGRRRKPPVGRQGPVAPEVPLADEMTAVAGWSQPLGKRGNRCRQGLCDYGGEELVARPVGSAGEEGGEIDPSRMDAGEECHARGGTDARRRRGSGVPRPGRGEPVKCRGDMIGPAIAAQIVDP